MNDEQLDRLIADANPVVLRRDIVLAPAELELCEAIMSTPTTSPQSPADGSADHVGAAIGGRGSRHRGRWLAAAAVVAAAAGASVAVLTRTSEPTYAAAVIEIAERTPRLLLAAPGWTVDGVQDFGSVYGEMSFTDGTRTLELFWNPVGERGSLLDDRANSASDHGTATITGSPADVFIQDEYITAVWAFGAHVLEARMEQVELASFEDVATHLEPVETGAWLDALPESVVRPSGRAAEVLSIVADIPTPPGFDADEIARSGAVGNRAQLGMEVTRAVTCGWLEAWFDAEEASDTAAMAQAAGALAGSRSWAILQEMEAIGSGWPGAVYEYADAVNGGPGIATGGGFIPIARGQLWGLECR